MIDLFRALLLYRKKRIKRYELSGLIFAKKIDVYYSFLRPYSMTAG